QAPGRALASTHQLEIPFAFDQVAHPHVDAQSAAISSRAAGIGAQPAALDQHRALELDPFDRAVAHVALANGNGAGLAVLERPPAPAAAFDTLHHEPTLGGGMYAEEDHAAPHNPLLSPRHPLPPAPP